MQEVGATPDGYVPIYEVHHSRTMAGQRLLLAIRVREVREAVYDALPRPARRFVAWWIGHKQGNH